MSGNHDMIQKGPRMKGAIHLKLKISLKKIKEMCGEVSFKRGEAFFRGNKVRIHHYSETLCEATIDGLGDMKVKIEVEPSGKLMTQCTCPKLASYKKDCQHIAAVLLALYTREQEREEQMADHLFAIFEDQPHRSRQQQHYFENREVLDVSFIMKVVKDGTGSLLLGLELQIGTTPVPDITRLLLNMRERNKSLLSDSFTFDPTNHCFKREDENIIEELIQIQSGEEFFKRELHERRMLLLSPFAWTKLFPLLQNAANVMLEEATIILTSRGRPSLQFELRSDDGEQGQLFIKGIHDLQVLPIYGCVIEKSEMLHLGEAECKRLLSLQHMLQTTNGDHIPIGKEQLPFFMEKVLPSLKKLGNTMVVDSLSRGFVKAPLVAKLYLDRVNHRLLASLEFRYGQLVWNPLNSDSLVEKALLVREATKEEAILKMMEASQFATTEEGYYLQNEELEYDFLYHILPKLEELVQVYATTAVRNRIFKGPAHPKIRVKVKKERTNWLEFKFELGIPEQEIKDLLKALEEKRKYYRLKNGSLLSLETREFEEINRFLHSLPIEEHEDMIAGLEVSMLTGISFLEQIIDHPSFSPEDSFQQFLRDIGEPNRLQFDESNRLQFDVPDNLEKTLREYQKHGYNWLRTLASYGFGGILADDMGLGKSLQSITYIQSVLPDVQETGRPILIVCPTSLTYNWLSEFVKFTPKIEAIVIDGDRKERQGLRSGNAEVLITSYTLLRKDLDWYKQQNFHTVFFDEAQAFKNPTTQTFRAVKEIRALHRFALTGTPVENSLEELWSIFHVVFPELFRGLSQYAQLTKKQVARRTRPFLLRRMKTDVLEELPDKIERQIYVELLPEQKKLYAAYLAKLRADTLKHLDRETLRKNRIRILAGITRLRQICCHPELFVDGYKDGSAKFNKLLDMIAELKASGRRVLIFSQFTKMLELIGRQLAIKGLSFFYLDGQTPSEERVEMCERFNGGEHDFFLISLKAGGTGLNLTGADTVILYDIWWNPAVEEQAMDRAYRIGQQNTVQVIKLLTKGTIEEKIDELQQRKRQLVEEIIDAKEMNLTEDDIRELLMVESVEDYH